MELHRVSAVFTPQKDELLRKLGLEADSDEAADFLELLDKTAPHIQPKASYLDVRPEVDPASGRVVLNGIDFQSRILAKHLTGAGVVWPHLATCGREVYDYAQTIPDPFERFWVEEIMQSALNQARAEMLRDIEKRHGSGKVAGMGPGSLVEWPLEQQIPLFQLLREGAAYTGVELTPTLLMLPNKSISGVLFPSEAGWESCQLCPRENCSGRRAPYDPSLAETM